MATPTGVAQLDPSFRGIPGFLAEVRKLIDNVVYFWDDLLIRQQFRQPLREAWEEWTSVPSRATPTVGVDLSQHGVEDDSKQLDLKLKIVRYTMEQFIDWGSRWLDGLLDAINDVLGSIPGAEALEELKKAIENLIQLTRRGES